MKKIKVDFHDPSVKFLKSRKLSNKYFSKNLSTKMVSKYDCVIIATDHSNIDYDLIKKNSKLIVDTKNVFKKASDKILKL